MQNFKNKVVWITGASSGIGKELAIQLAEVGAHLILSARNKEALQELSNQITGDNHFVLPLDLSNSINFSELADQVFKKYHHIDYLFNSGGVSQRSEAWETDLDVDRKIMEVNYFGNIALTKAVLPYMQKQKSGHIVVTSSIAGKFGFFLRSAYAASKHALHGFYESLLLEEEKNGIYVTIVCPGKILTPISVNALKSDGSTHGVMDKNQETGMSAEECVRQMLKATIQRKKEVLIGNKEIKAVTLKRFLPNLFWKVIKKQSAT
jgi:short-subunit dehydrogenase